MGFCCLPQHPLCTHPTQQTIVRPTPSIYTHAPSPPSIPAWGANTHTHPLTLKVRVKMFSNILTWDSPSSSLTTVAVAQCFYTNTHFWNVSRKLRLYARERVVCVTLVNRPNILQRGTFVICSSCSPQSKSDDIYASCLKCGSWRCGNNLILQ